MKKMYDIIWLDSTDSTNNEAIRNLHKFDKMKVIAAKNQTAGRGQRGNKWSSKDGENLTFSILLHFGDNDRGGLRAADQFAISEVATLSLVEFLGNMDIDSSIKWSNDIYVGNRKISGMLIENSLNKDMVSTSVIGIGLNVNQLSFPENLPNPVSMAQLSGKKYDCEDLLIQFMDIFSKYLDYCFDHKGRMTLRNMFIDKMYRKDTCSMFTNLRTGEKFEGIIRGISDLGLLAIENNKGEILKFGFKEIAFII